MINNLEAVLPFMPAEADGDTFCYTELLDRSKATGGNNRVRLLRTFYHHSQAELREHFPLIQQLCDRNGVRAYTRLSPRSYAKVGRLFATLVVESALVGHWKDQRHIYARCCGRVTPNRKLWLIDVDDPAAWADWHNDPSFFPTQVLGVIPSRKGFHVIVNPWDQSRFPLPAGNQVHRDNPTNLYIPESAQ